MKKKKKAGYLDISSWMCIHSRLYEIQDLKQLSSFSYWTVYEVAILASAPTSVTNMSCGSFYYADNALSQGYLRHCFITVLGWNEEVRNCLWHSTSLETSSEFIIYRFWLDNESKTWIEICLQLWQKKDKIKLRSIFWQCCKQTGCSASNFLCAGQEKCKGSSVYLLDQTGWWGPLANLAPLPLSGAGALHSPLSPLLQPAPSEQSTEERKSWDLWHHHSLKFSKILHLCKVLEARIKFSLNFCSIDNDEGWKE